MRRQRLSLLREPQELFVERLAAGGTTWLLEVGHDAVDYGVVASGGTLVKNFYEDGLASLLTEVFTNWPPRQA